MNGGMKQLGLVLVFAAVLGSVFYFRKHQPGPDPEYERLDRQAALERYGFYLEEVSKQRGIGFTHQAPVLDPKLNHIMPIIASMGAAVAVADFDRDGLPDLYVVNSGAGSRN